MKKSMIGMMAFALCLSATAAFAGDADNVLACVKAANRFSGIVLNEFDASYQGKWLDNSVAEWNNARCEVKLGIVYELIANGDVAIFHGYAGKASYAAYREVEQDTYSAIAILENRIDLLKKRLREASSALKEPSPDHRAIREFIAEGIEEAL